MTIESPKSRSIINISIESKQSNDRTITLSTIAIRNQLNDRDCIATFDTFKSNITIGSCQLSTVNCQLFYSDGWGAYERHIDPVFHTVGKRNTQKIERKHLTLRTRIKRLARKTICFSKSVVMHDVVIGLFINRVAFGLNIP